ncbi:MAG: PEP/pyruvate-binding domain-containing protein [bacterium]
MEEKLISKALEANLAETRYKDIKIPSDYQEFIDLSEKYFGINKRANDCIIEYQHPFSNRIFVVEELRGILLTDYWFYVGLDDVVKAFEIPLRMMRKLLLSGDETDLHVLAIRTLLEFTERLFHEEQDFSQLISQCCETMKMGFEYDPESFILATRYFKRHMEPLSKTKTFGPKLLALTRAIYQSNLEKWSENSQIENWLDANREIMTIDPKQVIEKLGKPYFSDVFKGVADAKDWKDLVSKYPDHDALSEQFAECIDLFPTFVEKFYFIFYLLRLEGMSLHKERLIWRLNQMLVKTIDEISHDELIAFVDKIFSFADELRSDHASSVLDILLTMGKKLIDITRSGDLMMLYHFENMLINFGFETPGMVYVNENWQLSVNSNHIKNIRVWLELIEYSGSEMERLLSALIVNLQLGGIFISDTDLFQREITKILNSNISPYYKKVKQLTRIFPVYFNEIGAEGEIRKVTTTMDEISKRKDLLVHFLRKQVHTESNNTLITLTRKVFRFWYDGDLKALEADLPKNVYDSIDTESEWFAPIHRMVRDMAHLSNHDPDTLLSKNEREFEQLIKKLPESNERDRERLRDIRRLYAFLKEKYSFETVDITALLRHYSFFEEKDIVKLGKALSEHDFETGLKLIYAFMTKLKDIIFNPKPSQSWENIYHKRHIAIGIPSMYGVYREPKFEALGLTFRLENVATRLMEKVVEQINLNYISAKTLHDIYFILDYFREGLELDGIVNTNFNANLLMLKYSLQSQSFSFEQYINIFQFIAEDVKRTIVKHFLKTYEIPLQVVIPQLYDKSKKLSQNDLVELINKVSETFYRDVIADAFLMQPLDNFISRILESLRNMADNLKPSMINAVMSYNSDLVITRLSKPNPLVDNQVFLGSKAFHLKNLRRAGFPIPSGFVITTEVFRRNKAINGHEELKKEMREMIQSHLKIVERDSGKQFGNPGNPLLLSVRSGAAISMPGAMDTFLNVGMNDEITESLSKKDNFGWTAWDSYRRLIQSWGMAYGLSRDVFDEKIGEFKARYEVSQKADFKPSVMREIALDYKKILHDNDIHFEENLFEQLMGCVNLVFESWSSERAKVYRKHLGIADEWGTAVIVQRMVFGNLGKSSGTGVVFTMNPKKKQHGVHLYGDFTLCSQGEDIVAGLVKPLPVSKSQRTNEGKDAMSLEELQPQLYQKIQSLGEELIENYGYSPQEMEFTFESENPDDLYLLQTRDMDMARHQAVNVFIPPEEGLKVAGRGIGIGGSALNGRVAFDLKDIRKLRRKYKGEAIILVRPDTVPDDIGMIFETAGLLTAKGGATSHAAVTAVRLGKTSVVNCTSLVVDDEKKTCTLNQYTFRTGDKIAIDGYLGNVYSGNHPIDRGHSYSEFRF